MRERLDRFKEALREWIVRQGSGPHATAFLFWFSLIEMIISPIPIETALVPLVLVRARSWIYYTVVATLGAVLGGLIGYGIGYFFYETLGRTIVALYGVEEEIAQIRSMLGAYTFSATFLVSFTPLPDKVFMPIAGLLQAPFIPFFIALVLGRAVRFALVAYLAHRFGAHITRLAMRYFAEATVALAVIAAIIVLFWLW